MKRRSLFATFILAPLARLFGVKPRMIYDFQPWQTLGGPYPAKALKSTITIAMIRETQARLNASGAWEFRHPTVILSPEAQELLKELGND